MLFPQIFFIHLNFFVIISNDTSIPSQPIENNRFSRIVDYSTVKKLFFSSYIFVNYDGKDQTHCVI